MLKNRFSSNFNNIVGFSVFSFSLVTLTWLLLAWSRSKTTEFSVVYSTAPNKEVAEKVASYLLENKLAACVNAIPGIQSSYWWQNKIVTDQEIFLIIKTKRDFVNKISKAMQQLHTYDIPEVLMLPVQGGSEGYLNWLKSNMQKG